MESDGGDFVSGYRVDQQIADVYDAAREWAHAREQLAGAVGTRAISEACVRISEAEHELEFWVNRSCVMCDRETCPLEEKYPDVVRREELA